MADALDYLRQDALAKRVKGAAGGHRIVWSAKDIVRIRDHLWSLPETALREVPVSKLLRADPNVTATGIKLAEPGLAVRSNPQPTDLKFVFKISSEAVDLMDDVIQVDGWDLANFGRNSPVLFAHNSSALPIAKSSMPWVSGKALMAIATFPDAGISAESDQVAAMLRAGMIRGASVGFVPRRFSFSKDPNRPLGIDFQEVQLLEWSVCSIPCNPGCLMVGVASDSKAAAGRTSRTVPKDDYIAPDGWTCASAATLPIDSSDDAYDAVAAKAAILAKYSETGTITADAAGGFLLYDATAPSDPASYRFPFAKVADNVLVACKTGWRQSFAALEMSDTNSLLISDARGFVEGQEARLGEVKMAGLRAEARALAKRVAALPEPAPLTRDERVAQAREFKRQVDAMILRDAKPGAPLTGPQQAARDRQTRLAMDKE